MPQKLPRLPDSSFLYLMERLISFVALIFLILLVLLVFLVFFISTVSKIVVIIPFIGIFIGLLVCREFDS